MLNEEFNLTPPSPEKTSKEKFLEHLGMVLAKKIASQEVTVEQAETIKSLFGTAFRDEMKGDPERNAEDYTNAWLNVIKRSSKE